MTGALPSPPGQCHGHASRTGVCTFPDHQILAVLTVPARCRLAAAASSPGPGRIQDRAEGMEVPAGFPAYLPGCMGLIGRGIVVPFQVRPAGRGIAAGSAARVMAASQRGAAGGAVTGHGGNRDGIGEGHVAVPHRDRAGGPEPGVALLAPEAGQPAEGVDAPAGTDRAGAGVGFAERCRIGIPADARAHLAPHDRHPQLITDHSSHRGPGRASGRGWGSGPGQDSGGSGPGGGGGRGWSDGPGEGFWPGTAGSWPGADMAGRHGVAGAGLARRGHSRPARRGQGQLARHSHSWPARRSQGHWGQGQWARPCPGRRARHFRRPEAQRASRSSEACRRALAGSWSSRRASRRASGEPGWRGVTCPGDGRAGPAAARPDSRAPVASAAGCGPLPLRVALPVQSGPAYRVRVRSSHHLGLESQPDKHAVNVRPIYELSRRGVWTIPVSSACTGRGSCSPS